MSADKPDLEIAKLLAAAVSHKDPPDMTESIMARVASIRAMVEFGRLLSVAPFHPLLDGIKKDDKESDDE